MLNGEYALALARRGFRILPCCWPDEQGECACGWNHAGSTVGKAPRVSAGVKDATNDLKTISQWWQGLPYANVSIALEPNYIMLDPDSPDALAEVTTLGVPPTLTRISRNKGFIFKAPPDTRAARIVHKGRSKAIDIFTNGYCLVYGTHRTGVAIYFEEMDAAVAPPPAWLLDWINEQEPAVSYTAPGLSSTAPVRLNRWGDEWWSGLKVVEGPQGVDRSATLFRIGLELAKANASIPVIREALAERDIALGFIKYADRNDVTVRYAEIAEKVVQSVMAPSRALGAINL